MSDFEEDLSNVMGSFISMELDYIEKSSNELEEVTKERDLYKDVIEEVREYITSYSSIHTIQFGTEEDSLNDIELNKTLDVKTMTEMIHRYLKVHDKLLQILDKVKDGDVK